VSVTDLLTHDTLKFIAPLLADSLHVTRGRAGAPDTIVFFAKQTSQTEAVSLGVASAETLSRAASLPEPASSTTVVQLGKPYERLEALQTDIFLLLNRDGSASIYNLSDARVTELQGWRRESRYVGAGQSVNGQLFSERISAGKRLLRPFAQKNGQASEEVVVPAPVTAVIQVDSAAYVLAHPGALGLLTYYAGSASSSYVAVGFLTKELSP
jgi:hypothetical protein